MGAERIVLAGGHVRLEPLDPQHADGLVAASAAEPALYQWSTVPQGKPEMTRYIDTALPWRDAGAAVPFPIVRLGDGTVSAPVLLRHGTMGMATGPSAQRVTARLTPARSVIHG